MKYGTYIERRLGSKRTYFPLRTRKNTREFDTHIKRRTAQQQRRANVRWYRICLGRMYLFPPILEHHA